MMKHWWQQDTTEVVKHLNSDAGTGLATAEAQDRLRRYGPNQLKEAKGRSPVGIFFEQFQDFVVWILIGATLASGFLKEWVDALAIG